MKKTNKALVVLVWTSLIYILFKLNLLTGNMNNIHKFLNNFGAYKDAIFVILSSLRIAALIPSALFMILGGMLFNPFEAFTLTFISVVLSETIIYIVSKILLDSTIQNHIIAKHPKFYKLLLKNNVKILFIGILCPIAPSDAACFLAASTRLSYIKFILISITANMPMIILYSILGNSIMYAAKNILLIVTIIISISLYSIYLLKKERREEKIA